MIIKLSSGPTAENAANTNHYPRHW